MFHQEKTAAWFSNEAKRNQLRSLISSPVFQEAASLILESEAQEWNMGEYAAPDVVMARKTVFDRGMRHFLNRLEAFTMEPAPPAPAAFDQPWEHYEHR